MRLPAAGAQFVTRERAVLGWSLRTAAEKSEMSVGTWQRIEGQEEIEYRSLMKAVLALGWDSTAADQLAAGLDPNRQAFTEPRAGELIAATLQQRGMTPHTLAVNTGISEGRIQRIIDGQGGQPASSDLVLIDRALGWEEGRLEQQFLSPDYTMRQPPTYLGFGTDDVLWELAQVRNRLEEVEARLGIPLAQPPEHSDEWLDWRGTTDPSAEREAERRGGSFRAPAGGAVYAATDPDDAAMEADPSPGAQADRIAADHAYAADQGDPKGPPPAGTSRPRSGAAPAEQDDA